MEESSNELIGKLICFLRGFLVPTSERGTEEAHLLLPLVSQPPSLCAQPALCQTPPAMLSSLLPFPFIFSLRKVFLYCTCEEESAEPSSEAQPWCSTVPTPDEPAQWPAGMADKLGGLDPTSGHSPGFAGSPSGLCPGKRPTDALASTICTSRWAQDKPKVDNSPCSCASQLSPEADRWRFLLRAWEGWHSLVKPCSERTHEILIPAGEETRTVKPGGWYPARMYQNFTVGKLWKKSFYLSSQIAKRSNFSGQQ